MFRGHIKKEGKNHEDLRKKATKNKLKKEKEKRY